MVGFLHPNRQKYLLDIYPLKKSSKNFFDTLEGLAARRYGQISQEASGIHCHWLVSWLLLGTVPSAGSCIFEARAPGAKLPIARTTSVSRRRKTTEKTSRVLVEKNHPDIFCEDTNGASMFLVNGLFSSREIHRIW